jgi:hypothetical protein
MSDFSELCPLFETGVFKEVTFPYVNLTNIAAGVNALMGTIVASHSGRFFTFGRTVVVTGGFVRRVNGTSLSNIVELRHYTSVLAAGTSFGTLSITNTGTGVDPHLWQPMAAATKTFTSDEVLGFSVRTATTISAGIYDIIVRYKEK